MDFFKYLHLAHKNLYEVLTTMIDEVKAYDEDIEEWEKQADEKTAKLLGSFKDEEIRRYMELLDAIAEVYDARDRQRTN